MKNNRQILDLSDELAFQIAPLRLLEEHIGALTEKAGSREGGKHRTIEVEFDTLFTISQTLHSALENIERVVRLPLSEGKTGAVKTV